MPAAVLLITGAWISAVLILLDMHASTGTWSHDSRAVDISHSRMIVTDLKHCS